MKKILFMSCAAAALMFASCASDEDVKMPQGNAISFANAFVNNSTRAAADDLDANTLKNVGFGVYGYMDGVAGVLFNNEKVTNNGTDWTYGNTQYWTAGKNYWFAAIAPYDAATFTAPAALPDATGITPEFGTLAFSNAGNVDLLYACSNKIAGQATGNQPVAFTFNHLLARTQFTFTNAENNENISFKVTSISIENAVKDATITLGDGAKWVAGTAADNIVALNYAKENPASITKTAPFVSEQNYMIPVDGTYNVKFHVQVFTGATMSIEKDLEATITVGGTGEGAFSLVRGNSYNFTCALTYNAVDKDAEPIEFTVTEVKDWTDWADQIFNL